MCVLQKCFHFEFIIGKVWNPDTLIDMVKNVHHKHRFFKTYISYNCVRDQSNSLKWAARCAFSPIHSNRTTDRYPYRYIKTRHFNLKAVIFLFNLYLPNRVQQQEF